MRMPVKMMMMMMMIIGKQAHSGKKLQKDFSNHVQKINSELKLHKIFTVCKVQNLGPVLK